MTDLAWRSGRCNPPRGSGATAASAVVRRVWVAVVPFQCAPIRSWIEHRPRLHRE